MNHQDIRQDELAVQATNNCSFMSKASMVKLGYVSSEKVENYQLFMSNTSISRRAPLINRGYYIRHMAIRHFVNLLMSTNCEKQLQIFSLGCGFDPLSLSLLDQNVLLVECDFGPVVKHKITSLSGNKSFQISENGDAHSNNHHVLSCNLMDTQTLDTCLAAAQKMGRKNSWMEWDFDNPTLIISECVLTYLPTINSDKVLGWVANTFSNSMMVLYEQIYPDDAFAETMLKHFDKNAAKIHAIHDYPTIKDQRMRLVDQGFDHAVIMDMNSWWHFLGSNERKRIEELELFDEYEEWFIKCSHYFVSCGINGTFWGKEEIFGGYMVNVDDYETEDNNCKFSFEEFECEKLCRWGHSSTLIDDSRVFLFGGFGVPFGSDADGNPPKSLHSRMGDFCVYNFKSNAFEQVSSETKEAPASRLYHQAICIDDLYVFGGRSSPARPFSDLWRFNSESGWEEINTEGEIPGARFHHVCVDVCSSSLCKRGFLVFGGRGRRGVSNKLLDYGDFWLYDVDKNLWKKMPSLDIPCMHRMSAIRCGQSVFIIGGLRDGMPSDIIYEINMETWQCSSYPGISIFGAKTVEFPYRDPSGRLLNLYLLVGGLCGRIGERIKASPSVVVFDPFRRKFLSLKAHPILNENKHMWINHDIVKTLSGDIYVFGGGATCFSMGTRFQRFICKVEIDLNWRKFNPVGWIERSMPISRISLNTFQREMKSLRDKDEPFIVESVEFGPCLTKWQDPDYVSAAHQGLVSIHEIRGSNRLSFCPRNFEFKVLPWKEFIGKLNKRQETVYLRSIGSNPRKEPSNISESYEFCEKDVLLPCLFAEFIDGEAKSMNGQKLSQICSSPRHHSSVLRISSSSLHLWTHYDIMDNFLVHVVGEKFVSLFPPSQFHEHGLPDDIHQSSSPITNIYGHESSPFSGEPREPCKFTCAYTDILKPGDVLFIPALWFHNVFTMEASPAISINLFWKSLGAEMYDNKDLYGNKDLNGAVEAFKNCQKIINPLSRMPDKYRKFYVKRLVERLKALY